MKTLTWTKPYHGVSHLVGLPAGYQITLEQFSDTLAVVSEIKSGSFTPIREFAGAPRGVIAEGERWAIMLRDEFQKARGE